MPIYEYVCDACGHELEALQAISDDPLRDCPDCQAAALRKKISAAAFRLKGGGWYETDFKDRKKRNLAGESGGESKADSKADSKPDSKSDAKSDSGSKSGGDSKPAAASKPAPKAAEG